jgi:hypothetical protein
MKRIAYIVFFLFTFSSAFVYARRGPQPGTRARGLRFNFGPSIGIYSINTHHAQGPVPRMSAMAGFKKELRCDRKFKTFFLFGFDYFFHGLSYKSYYFSPGSIQLYDKNFDYTYKLFIQELDIPLQIKYSFTRENNSLYSPYVMMGYHLRYMLPARVTVSQSGNVVSNRMEQMNFRNPLINPNMNAFLSATFGLQKNTINNSHTGFFIEGTVRYGFSQYYFSTSYSASSMYINAVHLSLLLGFKF